MNSDKKTAVTLGSFDGLHRGHMSVIACALELQHERGLIPLAMLFDSHPMLAIMGNSPKTLLQPRLRDEILRQMNLRSSIVPFNKIKDMSCREFFEEIILGRLNAGGVCCGWNYRFGKGNEGGCRILEKLCNEYSVELRISPPIDFDGSPISSTRIRRAIESGDIPSANAMLGREFRYRQTVVSGDHRGRLMGAPTINQHFDPGFVVPKKGVYASATLVDGRLYPSVTNIGLRPSFENEDLRSETCIIGFSGNLYGREIEVRLFQYLRGEMRFNSMEELGNRIRADAVKAEEIFNSRGENDYV